MRRPAGEVMAPQGSWERGEEEAEWRAVDSCLLALPTAVRKHQQPFTLS